MAKCFKDQPGLYLHIPFCRSKCRYCHFYSENASALEELFPAFLESLKGEIAYFKEFGFNFETLYVGGGTPNSLSPSQLASVLALIHENLNLSRVVEKTIELNPEPLERHFIEVLNEFGFNRISLGVQSFVNSDLQTLGRTYNAQDISNTVDLLRSNGFHNINFDLIFAFKGQTIENFAFSLKKASEMNPTHISTYSMTFEERALEDLESKDENLTIKMYKIRDKILRAHGYIRYEISSFSRPNFECIHNLKYWLRHYYIGLGPSASGFFLLEGREVRYTNPSSIRFHKEIPKTFEPLSEEEKLIEEIFLKIRTRWGWKADKNFLETVVQKLKGLVTVKNNSLILTSKGVFVADKIAIKIIELYEDYKKRTEIQRLDF